MTTRATADPVLAQMIAGVAATDADLQIVLRRKPGDTTMVGALGAGGGLPAAVPAATERPIPPGIVSTSGIADFGHVTVVAPDGTRNVDTEFEWCPSNPRAPGAAPGEERYPLSCSASPFATGLVWGVEQGWVGQVPLAFYLSGPDGTYRATVSVRAKVADALGFASDARTITFPIEVRTTTASSDSVISTGVSTAASTPGPSAVSSVVSVADSSTSGQQTGGTVPGGDDSPRDPSEASVEHTRPDASLSAVTPPADTLADLRPIPAYGISTSTAAGTDLLDFAASVWNAGPAPFVVEGYRTADVGGIGTMDAVQLFFRGTQLVATKPVGTFVFHAGGGHDHWHFLDFVRYDLLDTNGAIVATSGKQAWCLAPTEAVDLFTPGAVIRPAKVGLRTTCGTSTARFLRESLSPGWGDTYGQSVTGQALDISKVPNGRYVLAITVNPTGRFLEAGPAAEISKRPLELAGNAGARTVSVPPIDGVDTG